MRFALATPILALPAALGSCPGSSDGDSGPAGPLDRPSDGIVVAGSALPWLAGAEPGAIAAFRWTEAEGFDQVPLQVDERAVVTWEKVYGGAQAAVELKLSPEDTVLAWCDPDTYTGADPDPLLDADDEVALGAVDAGERAPPGAPLPIGVLPGGVELKLVDPLDGSVGWLYLLRHDGSLDPAAGEDRIGYTFALASGFSYLEGYSLLGGPNPELSSVDVPGVWSTSFSDRWVRDALRVRTPGASGENLLDRERTGSDPPECVRNEDTFCGYTEVKNEGAFLANVDGPVRAIRSVAGANSGVLTQRDHVFWPHREDMVTRVRLHPIDYAIQDSLNLAPSALGARLYAPWLPAGGIELDGDPLGDPVPVGKPSWEMLTGEVGTVIASHKVTLNDPGAHAVPAFEDDLLPPLVPCTGEGYALDVLGWRFQPGLGNTDPRLKELYGVVYQAYNEEAFFFEPPDQAPELAELRHSQHKKPIKVVPAPYGGAPVSAPPPPSAPASAAASGDGRVVAVLDLPGASGATWSLAAGELPRGLVLDPAGVLRGRAREPGEHRLRLRADHAAGSTELELVLSVPASAAPRVPGWVARLPLVGPWIERHARP